MGRREQYVLKSKMSWLIYELYDLMGLIQRLTETGVCRFSMAAITAVVSSVENNTVVSRKRVMVGGADSRPTKAPEEASRKWMFACVRI